LWLFRWGRGELADAQALVDRLARVASESADPLVRLQMLHARWATAFCLGDLDSAIAHARAGWALSGGEIGTEAMLAFGNHHAGVCARAFTARALALLGDAEAARAAANEAVARARQASHPFTLALALVFAAATFHVLRESETVKQLADDAESVSLAHGFALMEAWARALKGWTLRDTAGAEALATVRAAVTAAAATGSRQFQTWLLGILAETYLAGGLVDQGIEATEQALAYAETTGERFYLAQLHRVRAQLAARATCNL
jgi:hypothetical protein